MEEDLEREGTLPPPFLSSLSPRLFLHCLSLSFNALETTKNAPTGMTRTTTTMATTTRILRCPLPADLREVLEALQLTARNPYINEEEYHNILSPSL